MRRLLRSRSQPTFWCMVEWLNILPRPKTIAWVVVIFGLGRSPCWFSVWVGGVYGQLLYFVRFIIHWSQAVWPTTYSCTSLFCLCGLNSLLDRERELDRHLATSLLVCLCLQRLLDLKNLISHGIWKYQTTSSVPLGVSITRTIFSARVNKILPSPKYCSSLNFPPPRTFPLAPSPDLDILLTVRAIHRNSMSWLVFTGMVAKPQCHVSSNVISTPTTSNTILTL